MKVHLLHPDRDPRTKGDLAAGGDALVRDLGLDTLFDHMSADDAFLRDVTSRTVLTPLTDVDGILWRQGVLSDCLQQPDAARALYSIAIEGLTSQQQVRGWFMDQYPSSTLDHAIQKLQALLDPLTTLRHFADDHRDFQSPGMRDLMEAISSNLSDEYFLVLQDHLRRLRFPTGVVMTATLGPWGKGSDYTLRKPASIKRTWREFFGLGRPDELTWTLPDRDEAGGRALAELRDRGVNLVANALAQSTDHILSFLALLKWEMGFYLGCLNLRDALQHSGLRLTMPDPTAPGQRHLTARGVYDVCLGLRIGAKVVGNDLEANGASLVMITGANQGGKSTLLRAIGLAQLMMQAGMFVGADAFRASVAPQVHTHFQREEDATMERGKLDEELARMSTIVDRCRPTDLVLMNESFASTNEREGSQLARSIIHGLTEADMRLIYVTHLYDLASGLAATGRADFRFLRPQRLDDGGRTFKVVPGEPAATSHGQDVYAKVFGQHEDRRQNLT